MIYNYHTHTYRCRHAIGTERDYIERAIGGGVKYMGFSEHMPFQFPDGFESTHRMPTEEMDDYFRDLSKLRDFYKDKIDIKIGFEMEFYPEHFECMLDSALSSGAEYLLLGQHYIYNEHPDGISGVNQTTNAEELKEYVSCVIAGIKSGYFTYVAHPDFFYFVGDLDTYTSEMRKICVASREYSIPIEINFLGIREGRNYPNTAFWKVAGEEKAPVVFGFDAHRIEHAYDDTSLEKAKAIVKQYNLNYIGMPRLILIQDK